MTGGASSACSGGRPCGEETCFTWLASLSASAICACLARPTPRGTHVRRIAGRALVTSRRAITHLVCTRSAGSALRSLWPRTEVTRLAQGTALAGIAARVSGGACNAILRPASAVDETAAPITCSGAYGAERAGSGPWLRHHAGWALLTGIPCAIAAEALATLVACAGALVRAESWGTIEAKGHSNGFCGGVLTLGTQAADILSLVRDFAGRTDFTAIDKPAARMPQIGSCCAAAGLAVLGRLV